MKKVFILLLTVILVMLSGCTKTDKKEDVTNKDSVNTNEELTKKEEDSLDLDRNHNEVKDNDNSQEGQEQIDSEDPQNQNRPGTSTPDNKYLGPNHKSDLVTLSNQELAYFTDLLQQNDNQGFVTCEYETPYELDINEVIYSGAGSLPTGNPLYMAIKTKSIGLDGGDLFIYTTASINQLLESKLGITMEVLDIELVYPYLSEEEAYYHEVFDTNYVLPTCVSGGQNSEYVYLTNTTIYETGEWELVLKKKGDSFLFVSNISKSARENRSYVEDLIKNSYRFSMVESADYYFYYDDMSGTLVYAVDKVGEYIRTLYFRYGTCIYIQIDDEKIGPTEGYFESIGEPILSEFNKQMDDNSLNNQVRFKMPYTARDVNGFVPEGWHLLEYYDGFALAKGDLNKDGIDDIAFVLEEDSTESWFAPRILAIAFGNDSNTFTLSVIARDAILSAEEGGVWGDPFEGIVIENDSIYLKFYGGSNWRWGYSYQFNYREEDWYLIGATESNIHTGNNAGTIIDYNLLTGNYILTEYAEDGTETVKKGNYDKYFWYRLGDFNTSESDVFHFE